MGSNIPDSVFEDFVGELALKYFKHLKHNWNLEQYINEVGEVVKWEPLNEDYSLFKEKMIGSQHILVYTGEMLNSFNYRVDRNQFEIWTDNEVAKYHQNGTENIPARPMIFIDKGFIEREFKKYISKTNSDFVKWVMAQFKN